MTYEEYINELDENGVHTFYPPSTYEASDIYVIEEDIKLSSGGILYDCFDGYMNVNYSGTMPFGEAKAWGSTYKIILTLYNSGSPLFTKGGTFNAELYVYSTNVSLTVARGSDVETQVIDANSTEVHYVPISVDNTNADITKIEIIYNGGVPQSPGGIIQSAGIMKYGYILNEEEENHSKNIFELLKGFITGFFENITESFGNAIKGLFIPEEGYIQSKTEELKEQVNDSLGLLVYPITWLTSLFDGIKSADRTQAIFVFPEIKWEGLTVVPETPFDMYSFFYDNGFGFVVDICEFITSVVLVGAFIIFVQDTLRRILNDN